MSVALSLFGTIPHVLLRCASLLAPIRERETWLQEWRSELWYVSRARESEEGSLFSKEKQNVVFCSGAFRDAWILRCESKSSHTVKIRPSRSAMRCTAILFLLVIVSFGISVSSPNVRAILHPSVYSDSRHIVLISPEGVSREPSAVPMRQMRYWQRRAWRFFSEFAFYQPAKRPLRIASRYTPELSLARASANLFSLLGVQPIDGVQGDETMPSLLVSEEIWQREMHSDPRLLGSTIELGLRKAKLVGVISSGQWRLPGRFDAWLLEPKRGESTIPNSARGFVIGHLIPSEANNSLGEEWHMYASTSDGGADSYACVTLSSMDHTPTGTYIFMVLLALLALPATTSLPLGEYPTQGGQISWSLRLRRWMFLGVKFGLLLPVIYFVPLDFAYAFVLPPTTAQYIQIVMSFLIGLFGFRWALKDQRSRCPVCLCTLSNPARVGEPSRSFLGWNGTELICSEGHGLLHVPALPTSWLAVQRWLYLDSSWNGVFLGGL